MNGESLFDRQIRIDVAESRSQGQDFDRSKFFSFQNINSLIIGKDRPRRESKEDISSPTSPDAPKERKKLEILPRTLPLNSSETNQSSNEPSAINSQKAKSSW